jgi:hypothetical protein
MAEAITTSVTLAKSKVRGTVNLSSRVDAARKYNTAEDTEVNSARRRT